ncbi:MAG: Flp pilus assembly complex ATPase component TadA [Candidatus Aenigmarchaeota archaeon]|nr:Flp pilus assembly complex ATPase component TadA [Candidatus Aenigmarchaeota archaeon]
MIEKEISAKDLNARKIVPDTSVLIKGTVSGLINEGKIKGAMVVIPMAVIDELQAQASRHRDIGFSGLDEIKKIREVGEKNGVTIEFVGERPTMEEIQLAKKGRIDALIRDVAKNEKGILLTSDYVQALVAEAEGIDVMHIPKPQLKRVRLESFFTPDTQSVHLKTGVRPMAKKGRPGSVELVCIRDTKCTEDEIKGLIDEVMSKARTDQDSFIEISKQGAMVIQLGDYRIAITKPPFSDALELTAVRPIAKVRLSDYNLHKQLERNIVENSSGVLIAGPPGSGKSTFAASIADYLVSHKKIVKTFEQPRDLQVGPEVTEYAPLEGDWEKTAELLLLVRPDYTIFDEVRKTKDFMVFGDMRLAGVGMIGVVHSTGPVSAIQRFIGRLELGTIPHIIDTVIYIKDGRIEEVFSVSLTVKCPTGMNDDDLTRPVVEVRDFESKELKYEIYTYGEENVIVPVQEAAAGEKVSGVKKLARESIYAKLRKWDPGMDIKFLGENRIEVKVRNDVIAKMIGKKGKNIEMIERELGMKISVEPKEATMKGETRFDWEETGANFYLMMDPRLSGKTLDIYSGDDFLFSAIAGRNGRVKIRKRSEQGRKSLQAYLSKNLRVLL